MGTLNRYREIIETMLSGVARLPTSSPGVENKTLFDREANRYAVLSLGWEGARRIHHFLAHLEIIEGRIWVQEDNTDLALAEELERAGIPRSDIVLGFHPPEVRAHTDYAAV